MTLTPRQNEVLQLIAEGKINKEIASQLSISIKTVEKHRENLYDKSGHGPHNAVSVVLWAVREGLITV